MSKISRVWHNAPTKNKGIPSYNESIQKKKRSRDEEVTCPRVFDLPMRVAFFHYFGL